MRIPFLTSADEMLVAGYIPSQISSCHRHRHVLSYLYTDLDRLPVTALGVRDALGVVLPVVNHRLLVPRLLLQREDDAADVHVTVEETRSGK